MDYATEPLDSRDATSPQLRVCRRTGRWSYVAPARAHRPGWLTSPVELIPLSSPPSSPSSSLGPPDHAIDPTCPFCPAEPAATPAPSVVIPTSKPENDPQPWRAQVVPNLYPAVTAPRHWDSVSAAHLGPEKPRGSQPAYGIHDVVIDTARHVTTVRQMTVSECEGMLLAYQQRIQQIRPRMPDGVVVVFKNVGREAGASLPHSHSQILALPQVPPGVQSLFQPGRDWLARAHPQTPHFYSDFLEHEFQAQPGRWIAADDDFVLLAAYAPRMNHELCLMPRFETTCLTDLTQQRRQRLAWWLQQTSVALETLTGGAAWNWTMLFPPRSLPPRAYRWHLEWIPRVARIAGFEWATGAMIVDIPPEETAARLRPFFTHAMTKQPDSVTSER